MIIGLTIVLLLVLTLPFLFKQVEHNLEVFLFVMGLAAALISGVLGLKLAEKALVEPILLTTAVFVAGILFKFSQKKIKGWIGRILKHISFKVFVFLLVVILGLLSSVITAIIASLVLVEVVNALPISRKQKINLDIIACFSIGLGAALTPIGEPLATIAISKMEQNFTFLLTLLGPSIIPGIVGLGILGAFFVKQDGAPAAARETGSASQSPTNEKKGDQGHGAAKTGEGWSPDAFFLADEIPEKETYLEVITRAIKVYLFVMALVLLGEGFKPVIDRYVLGLSVPVLYWLNTVSAVLDNATLTAAEISIKMSALQVKSILMGLLISGGMLIPGNIPNIISAGKLRIGSKEWAKLGVPLGLVIMVIYFVILEVI
ncbi:MAG: DUF1646 domain-containing protein [Firmicutes bacterium]|nr:DUF1646 domain-containing protein [Bacillota bacterium]